MDGGIIIIFGMIVILVIMFIFSRGEMKCRKCGRIGIGEFSRNPFNKTDLCSKCFEKEARK